MATIAQQDSACAVASRFNCVESRSLCTKKEVVSPTDPEGYAEHQAALHAHYVPTNPVEVALVDRIASCTWRLRNVVALEAHLLKDERPDPEGHDINDTLGPREKRFMNLVRYEANLERSLYRAIKALKEAQAENCETNPSSLAIERSMPVMDLEDEGPTEKRNEPKPNRRPDNEDIETWTPGRRLNGPRRYPR